MDQETKIEIWEKFKDEFAKEGITSPDKLSFRNKIPSEQEQIKKGGVLKIIGRLREYTVWLFKTAITVIVLIVLSADLPDALEKHKTRYPKAFEAVDKVGQAVESYYQNIKSHGLPKGGEQYADEYVVFNELWRDDKARYFRDIKDLNESGKISAASFIVPGSGIEPEAILSTSASNVVSDLTCT